MNKLKLRSKNKKENWKIKIQSWEAIMTKTKKQLMLSSLNKSLKNISMQNIIFRFWKMSLIWDSMSMNTCLSLKAILLIRN